MARTMSQELKDKMAAGRAAARVARQGEGTAEGSAEVAKEKRASLADQVAAVQARANAGDREAVLLMPAVDEFASRLDSIMRDAKVAIKETRRKLRKVLGTLKD